MNKLYAIIVPLSVSSDEGVLQNTINDLSALQQLKSFIKERNLDLTVHPVNGTWQSIVEKNMLMYFYTDEATIKELANLVKYVYEQESVMYWVASQEVYFV